MPIFFFFRNHVTATQTVKIHVYLHFSQPVFLILSSPTNYTALCQHFRYETHSKQPSYLQNTTENYFSLFIVQGCCSLMHLGQQGEAACVETSQKCSEGLSPAKLCFNTTNQD